MRTIILILPLLIQVAFEAPSILQNRGPEEQKAANLHVFQILAQNGAVEGKEYRFDHTFTSSTKGKLEALISETTLLGFKAEKIEAISKQGETVYGVGVSKTMKFNRRGLDEDSLSMLHIAERLDIYYDGLGAEIDRNENEPNRSAHSAPESQHE